MNAPAEPPADGAAPSAPAPTKEVIEFAETELVGKLLSMTVHALEGLRTPWYLTSEHNQHMQIQNMRSVIERAVTDAVRVIVTERVPVIVVTLGKVEFSSDGIKAGVTLSRNSAGRHELADKTGSQAFILLAEPQRFAGGAEKVHAESDQAKLNLPPPAEEGAAESAGSDDNPVAEGQEQDASEKPPAPAPAPEIRKVEGGFMIYVGDTPLADTQTFKTHDLAESHLQKHLGIEKPKRRKSGGEPPAESK